MRIEYFIVYVYEDSNGTQFGRCSVTMRSEIDNMKDIRDIEKQIEKEYKHSQVRIINFQKIGD